jgi:uncharacterized protein YpmS
MSDKDLFKDYKPVVVEYDQKVDGGQEFGVRDDMLTQKEDLLEKMRKAKANAKGNQTTFRQNIRTENEKKSEKNIFEGYVPVVIEYDPEVDGKGDFELRDDRLSQKENLLEKMRKAKANAKGNQTTFRQNIRTENLEK